MEKIKTKIPDDKPLVLIIMGSKSDQPVADGAIEILKDFNIPFKLTVSSAHRTPERTIDIARKADQSGFKVIIAIAGWSAGLPGTIAAETILPVIGVPVPSSVFWVWMPCFPWSKCPRAFRLQRWRWGKAALKTPVCWPFKSLQVHSPI